MTHAISVPTPFNDISELAENFASRVDEERLMLPHSEPIPEGEWVQFTVSLGDGSAALSGMGRCSGAYDNGEDRAPEHRFDIVMDNLQLEEMAQIYFERILHARAAQMGEEPTTGQVEVPPDDGAEAAGAEEHTEAFEAVAAEEVVPAEPAAETAEGDAFEPPPEAFGDDATQAVALEDVQGAPPGGFAEEGYAEAIPAEAAPEADYADAAAFAEAEPAAAEPMDAGAFAEPVDYAEAPPAEEAAVPVADEYAVADEAVAQVSDADVGWADEAPSEEVSGMEMLDSVEQAVDDEAPPSETRSIEPPTELRIPEQSAIYELPPPTPPGALPSSFATNGQVLTRRGIPASWSPEPTPRLEPMPSSGYFQLAVAAALPQPAEPPRPQIDPSLRLRPAPRPGDPHTAPAAMTSAAVAAAPAYEEAPEADVEQGYAYEEAYEEQPAPEPSFGADETMEGLGLPAEDEGEYAEATEGYADYGDEAEAEVGGDEAVVMMDEETMDASMNDAYPPIAEQDDEAAYEPAPVGEETAVAVELPDDEER